MAACRHVKQIIPLYTRGLSKWLRRLCIECICPKNVRELLLVDTQREGAIGRLWKTAMVSPDLSRSQYQKQALPYFKNIPFDDTSTEVCSASIATLLRLRFFNMRRGSTRMKKRQENASTACLLACSPPSFHPSICAKPYSLRDRFPPRFNRKYKNTYHLWTITT